MREIARVGEVELAVEVEQQGLLPEGLPAVGHLGAVHESLLPHVLKPLAAVEGEQQVFLLGGRLQHARVGQDDGGVLVAVGHAVYHDAVELAGLHVLALHVEVALRQSIVEDALRYLQLGALLLHRDEELRHLLVGARTQVVLEVERADGDEGDKDNEGAECLHQRDAGGLDGGELARLAQVAEGDERGEQDGQGESLRHHHLRHVPEKLCHDVEGETFADEGVDVFPHKLHHQHEEADEECAYEKQAKLLDDEYVEFPDSKHNISSWRHGGYQNAKLRQIIKKRIGFSVF